MDNGSLKQPRTVVWKNPEIGFMKFNVDGAARGKPGPAGIGGVLRDVDGKVWMEFSNSIGVSESNEAEICAIRKALLLFCASSWVDSFGLVMESDSRNAVSWVEKPDDVPWRLRKWVSHIVLLKRKLSNFRIVHTFREANQEADALAKGGIDRIVPLLKTYC